MSKAWGIIDQLKNVGSPISNDRFVLQLVLDLTLSYSTIGTLIRQTNPLPLFYQARSMLTFEEAGFAKQTATGATSIMVAASPDSDESLPNSSSHSYHSGGVKKGQNCHYHNNKKSSGSKGGKGGGHDGGGG